MKPNSDIGVIFDMDGVLVDSAGAHLQSWQILAQELGHTVTQQQFGRTFGQQNRDIIPLLFGETSYGRIKTLGDRKETIYRYLIREAPPVFPGAIRLVTALGDCGVRLAVGSSGPRANIELILNAMGVTPRMSAIVTGDDVSRGKPYPDVFLTAAERLGLAPNRCVVIEDAPVGVEAARRAGMKCIAVKTHHGPDALGDAHLIVDNVAALTPEIVLELVAQTE